MTSAKSKNKEVSFAGSLDFSMDNEYREAIGVFEKFEKYDLQESLSKYSTNWLLSNDDIKLATEMPDGLCKSMPTIANSSNMLVLLVPCDEKEHEELNLDYREVYQMLRELTIGIYGFHQIPEIDLEANFDRTTVCDIPPIYTQTRIGQHLINVDYTMKCLWHGAYFPVQKRHKWAEKWKLTLAVNQYGNPETKRNVYEEFVAAGMVSVNEVKEFSQSYDDFQETLKRENLNSPIISEFFREKINQLSLRMNLFTNQVKRSSNVFLLDADWKIETALKTIGEDLALDKTELLLKLMKIQRDIVSTNLDKMDDIRKRIYKLKLIAILIPFFIGLRKRMMIPDVTKMMNPILGDELRTERDLPPLILAPNYPNVLMNQSGYFHLHGGIQFDLSTPEITQLPNQLQESDIQSKIETVAQEAGLIAQSESTYTDKNPVRTIIDKNNQRYFLIPIFFETYYNQAPKKPNWVRAISEETRKLEVKKLPLTDNHLFDMFKKFFGQQAAIQNKNVMEALRTCSRRGLVAMFQTECRKCSITKISKQDDLGWSLSHHAAMNNKVHLMGALLLQSQDVNVRRYNTVSETSPTPLHVAVITGSLYAVACLVSCGANIKSADKLGWMSVHCAAFYDQVVILNLLIRHDHQLINITTKNKMQQTPILVAAGSGSLGCVKILIKYGAYIDSKDTEKKGVIHMAVLSFRNQIIEYFIEMNNPKVPVWPILLSMLKSKNDLYIQKVVDSLEYLTKYSKKYWNSILKFDLVPAIVELLNIKQIQDKNEDEELIESEESDVDIELLISTTSLLCNICVESPIQEAMKQTDIIKIIVRLFKINNLLLKSQLSFITDHLCNLIECQELFAQLQGYKCIEEMINEASNDSKNQITTLVNGVNAIKSFCRDNLTNQILVIQETQIILKIIHFLSIRNGNNFEILLVASSFAISSIVKECNDNRNFLIEHACVKPLLGLIQYRINVDVQVAAANAIEHLCYDNPNSREVFRNEKTEIHLIHLLKNWKVGVKEQGMRSLWALAGIHITGQRYIAETIGASLLIELIMSKSDVLQSLGCCAMSALCNESKKKQELIRSEGGIQPLVRLLKQTASPEYVLKTAIEMVGIMCVGIAHCSNTPVQTALASEEAIEILVDLWNKNSTKDKISLRIEIGYALAALTLNHRANEERMKRMFNFCHLITILPEIDDKTLVLRCLTSLAVFCYNNTSNQFSVKEYGGIDYEYFERFLDSDDPVENIQSAFNMIIVARDIKAHDQVTITAEGVKIMVSKLTSAETHVIILAASLIASLCHTRAGIPDAFVSLNAVEVLLQLLHNSNNQVRSSTAVALGYLSFNGTASRVMMKECRMDFNLFHKLQFEIGKMDSKISDEFVNNYTKTEQIGLPYKYLECNGGFPINPSPTRIRIKSSSNRTTRSQMTSPLKQLSRSKRPVTAVVTSSTKKYPFP